MKKRILALLTALCLLSACTGALAENVGDSLVVGMVSTRTRMVFRLALLFWKPAIHNDLLAIRWGQYSTFRPLRASPGQPEGENSSFVHGKGKTPDAKFTKYSHRAQTLPEGVG